VFVKKSYPSSWVFTVMQSVHIRMNLSLSPPLKKSWIRLCGDTSLWLKESVGVRKRDCVRKVGSRTLGRPSKLNA